MSDRNSIEGNRRSEIENGDVPAIVKAARWIFILLGALTQTGILPFAADTVKEAMRRKTKKAFLDSNLKAFDLGYATAAKAA